jgi:hypothetical protein
MPVESLSRKAGAVQAPIRRQRSWSHASRKRGEVLHPDADKPSTERQATPSQWIYTEPHAIRLARVRRSTRRLSRNRNLLFETEICDFRQNLYRAAISAPLGKTLWPNPMTCILF